MKVRLATLMVVLAVAGSPSRPLTAQGGNASPTLRAGAAKVDVTPTELPRNTLGVHDRLYARAIVLDNGTATAALITVDAGGVSDATWQAVTQQLASEFRIPATHVLLTATHTHSAGGQQGADYVRKIVDAVRRRGSGWLRRASGYGTGMSYINVNRQITDPKTGRWWEGANREGPSDKTVAVLTFDARHRRADRGLLQLRRARRDRRAARRDQRRHSRRDVAIHRGLVRRYGSSPSGRSAPPAIRTRSTSSRPTTCAISGRRSMRAGGSTSATRCRPGARGWTGRIPPSRG